MFKSVPRWVALAAIAVLAVASLYAGGQAEGADPDGAVEVRFWALMSGADGEILDVMVDEFNSVQDDVFVQFDISVWDAYYQQLTAAISGGDAPDIAIAHTANLPAFADERLLHTFDYALDTGLLNPDDFTPTAWQGGFQNGRQFGVPFDTIVAMTLFYNTEYFEQAGLTGPPRDGAEFVEYAQILQERSDATFGFDMPISGFRVYRHWFSALYQNGGRLLSDDNSRAAFNTREGLEALRFWVDLVHRYGVAPEDQIADAFRLGEVAMTIDGVWMTGAFRAQEDLPWSIYALPALFLPENRHFFSNSHNFILPRQRQSNEVKVQGAQRFVAWMSDNSNIWSERAGMITARQDIIQRAGFYDTPHMEEIAKQVEYATYPPLILQTGEINSAIIQELELAIGGVATPEEALAAAERRVNEILAR